MNWPDVSRLFTIEKEKRVVLKSRENFLEKNQSQIFLLKLPKQ
jgi:hypothetical protein